MVALAQESTNVFSIIAEKNGAISDSVVITIIESSSVPFAQDTAPPNKPIINDNSEPSAQIFLKILILIGQKNT